jgi:hypothetical protein
MLCGVLANDEHHRKFTTLRETNFKMYEMEKRFLGMYGTCRIEEKERKIRCLRFFSVVLRVSNPPPPFHPLPDTATIAPLHLPPS